MINQSVSENDHTIIGICGFDNDRGKDFISFRERIRLIKKLFGGRADITLAVIDDKKIGLTGKFDLEAWQKWSKELFENSGFAPDDNHNEYVWYSGERDYLSKISMLYPNHKTVQLCRSIIPVSGTMIRQNPKQYREYIHPAFIDYLQEKQHKEKKL